MKTKCSIPKGFSGTRPVLGILIGLLAFSISAATAVSAAPFAYVSDLSGTVSVIDAGADAACLVSGQSAPCVIATVPVGDVRADAMPSGVAVNPTGTRAYVANKGEGTVSVIDVATNTIVGGPIPVGTDPSSVAVSADGARVYVTLGSGDVAVLDVTSGNSVNTISDVGVLPNEIAVVGSRLYVTDGSAGNVAVINGTTLGAAIVLGLNAQPLGIVAGPGGTPAAGRVYVAYHAESMSGPVLTVATIDTTTNAVVDTTPVELDATPGGIAVSPDGTLLYVANDARNALTIVTIATKALAHVNVGADPVGVATNSAGTHVFVGNLDDSVSVIATSGACAVPGHTPPCVVRTIPLESPTFVLGAFVTAGPQTSDPGPDPNPAPPSCEAKVADLQKKVAKYRHYKHHHGYYKLKTALRLRAEAVREIEKATAKAGFADTRIVKAKKQLGNGDEALCANRYWRAAHEYWEAYEIAHRVVKHYRYHRR